MDGRQSPKLKDVGSIPTSPANSPGYACLDKEGIDMNKTTKQDLEMRVTHVRRQLEDLGTPIDLSIDYVSGSGAKLVFDNGSRRISHRKTKSEIYHVLCSIENVLTQVWIRN